MSRMISIVIPARNPGAALPALLSALGEQERPAGFGFEIIVVDDGSAEAIDPGRLPSPPDIAVNVVRLTGNGNRSAARNAGARAGKGERILFLDCDCRPAGRDFVARLACALEQPGVVAAGGPVIGTGSGFWHRYQAAALTDRLQRAAKQQMPALTSASLMVARTAFELAGAFDERYTGYGFEDRDLVLRLGTLGATPLVPDAAVEHHDSLELNAVASKMYDAGRTSSALFRAKHPAAYEILGYGRIDASARPWLRPIALTLGRMAIRAAPYLDELRTTHVLPFWISRRLVKSVSALSFLYGTACRNNDM